MIANSNKKVQCFDCGKEIQCITDDIYYEESIDQDEILRKLNDIEETNNNTQNMINSCICVNCFENYQKNRKKNILSCEEKKDFTSDALKNLLIDVNNDKINNDLIKNFDIKEYNEKENKLKIELEFINKEENELNKEIQSLNKEISTLEKEEKIQMIKLNQKEMESYKKEEYYNYIKNKSNIIDNISRNLNQNDILKQLYKIEIFDSNLKNKKRLCSINGLFLTTYETNFNDFNKGISQILELTNIISEFVDYNGRERDSFVLFPNGEYSQIFNKSSLKLIPFYLQSYSTKSVNNFNIALLSYIQHLMKILNHIKSKLKINDINSNLSEYNQFNLDIIPNIMKDILIFLSDILNHPTLSSKFTYNNNNTSN